MKKLRAGLPLALGAMAYVAADNVGALAWLVFFAIVPLLGALQQTTGREAWRRGYLFGLVFGLGELFWLDQLTARWVGSPWLALVPWLVAGLLMALYFGLFAVLARRAILAGNGWAVPLIWAGVEVFRSYIPVFAFPWGLLGGPLWRFPWLIQTSHLGTIFLVSAWVAAINWWMALRLASEHGDVPGKTGGPLLKGTRFARTIGNRSPLTPVPSPKGEGDPVATFVQTRKCPWFGGVFVVIMGGLVVSLLLFAIPFHTRPVPVTLGQTGVDMAFGEPGLMQLKTDDAVEKIDRAAVKDHSSLLVLPEGVALQRVLGRPITGFRLDPSVPTLFGAQRGTGPYYQSAVGFDGGWQAVDKTRLVIFGEFVPGRSFLPFLKAFNLPTGDLSAGEHGTQAVKFRSLTVGPIICFEEMFPDISLRQAMNGSQMLAVLSIDDWFIGTSATVELTSASVWRAIETGLPVVRVTPLGESQMVGPHGDLLYRVRPGGLEAPTVNVPVPDSPIVPLWLPLFPVLCLAVTLIAPFRKPRGTLREWQSDSMGPSANS